MKKRAAKSKTATRAAVKKSAGTVAASAVAVKKQVTFNRDGTARKTSLIEEIEAQRKAPGQPMRDEVDTSSLNTFERIPNDEGGVDIIPIQQKESFMKKQAAKKEAAKKTAAPATKAGKGKVAAAAPAVKVQGKQARVSKSAEVLTKKVALVAKTNPKRPDTIQWKRWEKMSQGILVSKAIELGVDMSTLRGWEKQGHIKIG